jgi:hypothetical protein
MNRIYCFFLMFLLCLSVLVSKARSSDFDAANKLTLYSPHGNLLNDDPAYNKKSSAWVPAAEITGILTSMWVFDRIVCNYNWSRISFESWQNNLSAGWAWDEDQLYMNFLMHPLAGGFYFNTARSNGFSFYQSIPFTFAGSLAWEYLGENELPSSNDMINTPISGILLGEVMYRLSSNILDDRARGGERVIRELGAGLVNPVRGLNRLMFGTTARNAEKEIYQKEPVSIAASFGTRWVNEGCSFGTGPENKMLDLKVQYGDPFENRARNPFDYFTFSGNMYFGVNYKLTDNILATGIWYGKNYQYKDLEMLVGIFQHYDYWDNMTFELSTLSFGAGVATRLALGENKSLFTNFHLGVIPLAGNDTAGGPTLSDSRDYCFGNGLQAKFESALRLGQLNLAFAGYYYWIHHNIGDIEDNFIGILRPAISVDLNDFISIGFEQMYYLDDRYPVGAREIHMERTEQKLYATYFFRDPLLD